MGDCVAFGRSGRDFYLVNQIMKLHVQGARRNICRINELKILVAVCLLLPVISLSQNNKRPTSRKQAVTAFSTRNRTVKVYTTADASNLRLTLTTEVKFRELRQPLENQISVFVNPAKTFQSFLGIGGAITDASAEVFAKLPAVRQQELLDAYYSKNKGI